MQQVMKPSNEFVLTQEDSAPCLDATRVVSAITDPPPTVSYGIAPMHCLALHCIVLHCPPLSAMHWKALHCSAMYCLAVQCTALLH